MTRLHVQPLTPDLLRAILPASAFELVENLSYHSLQTFPDNNYGYFDLPAMEAEKLKKKLNGAILRGKKIKIEEATPRKRRHEDEEADVPAVESIEPTIESTARKSKRSRKEAGVIKGHSISADRKVKRGWTEVKAEKTKRSKKDKSNRPSSIHTDKEELLFQTKVPANKKDLVKEDVKKNGKKRNSNGDVVHEFEHTKSVLQPSFLRSSAPSTEGKAASTFIDGKGWVDEDGNVVEEEPAVAKRSRTRAETKTTRRSTVKEESSEESDSSSDDESTPRPVSRQASSAKPPVEDEDDSELTSSSGSSSEDASDSDDSDPASSQASSGAKERTSSPSPNTSMHPLEALFKKPSKPAFQDIAKQSLEVQTAFSFFDQNGDDLEEELIPGTPFSSQDTRSRSHRSAAPTPDTAHPSRYNSYSSQPGDSDGGDDEEGGGACPATRSQRNSKTPSKPAQSDVPAEQSAFEKQFWENRGELGRGWKRRRREVQKEKRQRENRANKRSW
jgi:hypothetical protein